MTIRLPRRLTAPAPGWTLQADVIVVGSGVAGLTTALHARAAGYRVLLVTKAQVDEGSTRWAQGGIAAVLRRRRLAGRPRARHRSSPASGCATRRPCGCW